MNTIININTTKNSIGVTTSNGIYLVVQPTRININVSKIGAGDYAPISHTHSINDITSLRAELDSIKEIAYAGL